MTGQSQTPSPTLSQDQSQGQTPAGTEINLRGDVLISRLFIACVSIEVAFVLLDYFVNYARWTELGPIRRMFNITREDGLASWFGITQTLLVGLTAWMIWLIRRSQRAAKGNVTKWACIGWFIVACGFTYMAVDDGATIHERLGSSFKALQERGDGDQGIGVREGSVLPDEELTMELDGATADAAQARVPNDAGGVGGVGGVGAWFPSYEWQILFVPVFGALGLFLLVFLWRELGTMRLRVKVFIALSCMACAVGLDFIEGLDRDHALNIYGKIANSYDFAAFTRARFKTSEFETLRHFSKSIEETLEMFAMTLFWVTFLTHWVRTSPRVELILDQRIAKPLQ